MTVRTGILLKQPLFYVLASMRFEPWMLLRDKIPEIQDALRDRFPVLNQITVEHTGPTPQTGGPADSLAAPSSPRPIAWAFHTADRRLGCQISADQIVVHALTYERFAQFADTMKYVVNILETHARHFDVSALGIRYLDKISPREGESLGDYLPEHMLPQRLGGIDLEPIGGLSQTMYKTKAGVLQAKFWTGTGYLSVPNDLIPLYVLTQDLSKAPQITLAPLEEGHGTLDSDSMWIASQPTRMHATEVIAKLSELHDHANDFFRGACTEHAFRVWGGESS